jgi:hypothetical protein
MLSSIWYSVSCLLSAACYVLSAFVNMVFCLLPVVYCLLFVVAFVNMVKLTAQKLTFAC